MTKQSNKQSHKSQAVHPNVVRATLGSATLLHSFLLPKAAAQTSETAPQQPKTPEPKDKDTMELNGIKQQIKALTLVIEQALNEDKNAKA